MLVKSIFGQIVEEAIIGSQRFREKSLEAARCSLAQQSILQMWKITSHNFGTFMKKVGLDVRDRVERVPLSVLRVPETSWGGSGPTGVSPSPVFNSLKTGNGEYRVS